MGGQGTSHRRHRHSFSPGGDYVSESELPWMAYRSPPSSSSCSCCCCPCCCSPSSELGLEDHNDSSRGVNDGDGGSGGASAGEHGEVVGGGEGEARFSGAGDDRTRNRGSGAIPLPEESISVDGARWLEVCTVEEVGRRRKRRAYLELLRSYRDGSSGRLALLEEAKDAIARYTPGKWIEGVSDTKLSKYRVPSTTTLLLVGPRGSGKSALVNRISRLLEGDPLLPDRAQVSHNVCMGVGTCSLEEHMIPGGTYFLQEYMIPRDSTSFCVYDTRGLSEVAYENFDALKSWMNIGVTHGEMVLGDKDSSSVKSKVKAMARDIKCLSGRRRVDFVIFVVDGISILKSIISSYTPYTDVLFKTFNCPFMSFKDNKPAVVVTHGDLLSFHDRAVVRIHLGELLGIPATKQIFDIPDLDCPMTNLAIVDLLRYSLEQADRNLPLTSGHEQQGTKSQQWMVKRFEDSEIWIMSLELSVFFICAFILWFKAYGF